MLDYSHSNHYLSKQTMMKFWWPLTKKEGAYPEGWFHLWKKWWDVLAICWYDFCGLWISVHRYDGFERDNSSMLFCESSPKSNLKSIGVPGLLIIFVNTNYPLLNSFLLYLASVIFVTGTLTMLISSNFQFLTAFNNLERILMKSYLDHVGLWVWLKDIVLVVNWYRKTQPTVDNVIR